MKRLIILSTILLTFFNCSVNEKPEFIGIDNIKVSESTSEYVVLTANAIFKNPNIISGEIQVNTIKVLINNSEVASVSSENYQVPAKKEFSIPLNANIPIEKVFGNENLSVLISSLLTKKMKVHYKGVIKYKVLGFSHTYDVDKTEDIKLQ
ncbi:hypothetical protein [Mariniflexile sp.]|uniref:hypothetical protein n=1 Tax=Mariniflexile sp. TaxID=1979402 RepID=UPI0035620DA6